MRNDRGEGRAGRDNVHRRQDEGRHLQIGWMRRGCRAALKIESSERRATTYGGHEGEDGNWGVTAIVFLSADFGEEGAGWGKAWGEERKEIGRE
ncbi:hypothetical protein E2C01_101462 [Portunus trituberculatus]|uniref:Uncharacterized protein n=1 Tax=Portunus trituberculatus TaxID=210409 RepID=A0A5B7KAT0_PORTR|nr:hypothetical protein [Portunus trituberculatus]